MTAPAAVSVPRGKSNGHAPATLAELADVPMLIASVPIGSIDIGPNVRKDVGDLDDLVGSIREHGVLQPIKVREAAGRYVVVWGQRRYLAAVKAGLETIPAIIVAGDTPTAGEPIEQLVENLIRADLNPIDEAKALRAVLDADPQLTQDGLAKLLGRSAPWVSNALRLLEASKPVQQLIAAGKLSASHGKALAALPEAEQAAVAKEAVRDGLSAHDIERAAAELRRQAKWDADKKAEDKKRVEGAVEIVKAKVHDLSTKIVVIGYGEPSSGAIAEKIRQAGYTDVSVGKSSYFRAAPPPAICDCRAVCLETSYGNHRLHLRHCVVDEHHLALNVREDSKRQADYSETSRQLKAAQAAVVAELEAHPLSIGFARLLYWRLMNNWTRKEWAKGILKGEKRPDPWQAVCSLSLEVLVAEIAKKLIEYDAPAIEPAEAAA